LIVVRASDYRLSTLLLDTSTRRCNVPVTGAFSVQEKLENAEWNIPGSFTEARYPTVPLDMRKKCL
jgi:hypothetical protein